MKDNGLIDPWLQPIWDAIGERLDPKEKERAEAVRIEAEDGVQKMGIKIGTKVYELKLIMMRLGINDPTGT